MKLKAAAILVTGGIGRVLAQDDQAALDLADRISQDAGEHVHDWHVLLEGAFARTGEEADDVGRDAGRASLDLHWQHTLSPGLQAVLGDRLDVSQQSPYGSMEVNALKEAYLSWKESQNRIFDLGRINVRNGVALAYNPTDYFRVGAVREVVSIDPASLRINRLGSVMLQAQQLWNGGSLTALVAPRLADHPSDGPFSADLGASNGGTRWLLEVSQHLAQDLAPQLLVEGESHRSAQVGLNLTHLLGEATVVFVEGSTGRSRSVEQLADGLPGPTASVTRLSTGLTYTLPANIFLTAEYEKNDSALSHRQWAGIAQSSPPALKSTQAFLSRSQDLPDRRAVLLLARWADSLASHLDLQGFIRLDLEDHSRVGWAEARRHFRGVDVALQWQQTAGTAATIYGNVMPRWLGRLVVDVYLP